MEVKWELCMSRTPKEERLSYTYRPEQVLS